MFFEGVEKSSQNDGLVVFVVIIAIMVILFISSSGSSQSCRSSFPNLYNSEASAESLDHFFNQKYAELYRINSDFKGKPDSEITLQEWKNYQNLRHQYQESIRLAPLCGFKLSERVVLDPPN